MIPGPDVNADLAARVVIDSNRMAWQETERTGVAAKVFERIAAGGAARDAGLIRLAAGADLDPASTAGGVEVLVLEGRLAGDDVDAVPGRFARFASGNGARLHAPEGAVFLYRRDGLAGTAGETGVWDLADRSRWESWGGGGNQRMKLGPDSGAGVWLGYLFPGNPLPGRERPGAEEVFVLHGALEDGAARLEPGTWIRLPAGVGTRPAAPREGALVLARAAG